jgi:hypothetical protein
MQYFFFLWVVCWVCAIFGAMAASVMIVLLLIALVGGIREMLL